MEKSSFGYFVVGLGTFVLATLVAEWATRKAWPEDYPSQASRR